MCVGYYTLHFATSNACLLNLPPLRSVELPDSLGVAHSSHSFIFYLSHFIFLLLTYKQREGHEGNLLTSCTVEPSSRNLCFV